MTDVYKIKTRHKTIVFSAFVSQRLYISELESSVISFNVSLAVIEWRVIIIY